MTQVSTMKCCEEKPIGKSDRAGEFVPLLVAVIFEGGERRSMFEHSNPP
jgi:hypothetical protein